MTGPRVVRLADPLPCCALAGWGYCGEPATLALAELRTLATGHVWDLRPYCPKHTPATEPKRKRGRAVTDPLPLGNPGEA